MSKKSDKEHIVKEICEAAKLYKATLVGKRFLYVFDGRYIEVLYKNVNFKHLTGVECNMSAADFYRNALKIGYKLRRFTLALPTHILCVKEKSSIYAKFLSWQVQRILCSKKSLQIQEPINSELLI